MLVLCCLLAALSRPPCLVSHDRAVLQGSPVGLPDPKPFVSFLDHNGHDIRTAQGRADILSFAHLPQLLLEELNEIIMYHPSNRAWHTVVPNNNNDDFISRPQ